MSLLSRFRSFVLAAFFQRRLARDMELEMRAHLEARAADLERDGLSPEDASAQALREFGDADVWKDAGLAATAMGYVPPAGTAWALAFLTIWDRRWIVIVPTVLAAAVSGLAAYSLPVRYESLAVMATVPARASAEYMRPLSAQSLVDRLPVIQKQVLNPTRLAHELRNLGLIEPGREGAGAEAVIDALLRDIRVELVTTGEATPQTTLRVAFSAADPQTARNVANRVSSMMMEASARDLQEAIEGTYRFVIQEADETRARLEKHEQDLLRFEREHGRPPSQLMLIEYDALQEAYRQLRIKRNQVTLAANFERRAMGQQWRMLDQASLPVRPTGPDPALLSTAGTCIGLGLGLALAAVSSGRRRRVMATSV